LGTELKCEDVRRELVDYLDDELSLALREQIDAHLATCKVCIAIYDGVRNVMQLSADGRTFQLPPKFSQRLYIRLLSQGLAC
jgi:predicted anti-sigma-YlaC factor YlaD